MGEPADHRLDVLLLEEESSALEEVGSVIGFPAGSILMGQNERTDFVLLIRKGHAKVVVGEPRRTVGIRGPGELVGEMAAIRGGARSASIFALSDVEALHISGSKWIDFLIGHPRVALAQLFFTLERLAESTQKNVESLLGGEQKLAKALIELLTKGLWGGAKERPEVRLSQQELADIAGIKIDSVKQIIRSFKDRGIVATKRQVTTILDLDALHAVCRGESTASLRVRNSHQAQR